jgi:hypothetical protein
MSETLDQNKRLYPLARHGYNVLAADLLQGCPFCVKCDYIQFRLANATYSGDTNGRNKGPESDGDCGYRLGFLSDALGVVYPWGKL